MTDFPEDADGQALKMLADSGSDFAKPMDVDFDIAAPTEEAAVQIANALGAIGFRTQVYFDDEIETETENSDQWTCECSRVMQLSYESLKKTQQQLDEIAKPLQCYVDGWSSYGNGD